MTFRLNLSCYIMFNETDLVLKNAQNFHFVELLLQKLQVSFYKPKFYSAVPLYNILVHSSGLNMYFFIKSFEFQNMEMKSRI
jgi:hypothetical protein